MSKIIEHNDDRVRVIENRQLSQLIKLTSCNLYLLQLVKKKAVKFTIYYNRQIKTVVIDIYYNGTKLVSITTGMDSCNMGLLQRAIIKRCNKCLLQRAGVQCC